MSTDGHELHRSKFTDAVFTATHIEHKRLVSERSLTESKWQGYRFLTPLEATKHFYRVYQEHVVRFVEAHVDRDLSARVAKKTFEQLLKRPGEFTAVWAARQRADLIPVPYELYIEFCMWFWSRRTGTWRRNAPRPNQLGSTATSHEAWWIEFEKYIDERLPQAAYSLKNVPQLHPAAFRGTTEQQEARDLILELCRTSSGSWPNLIELWCYGHPLLTPLCFRKLVEAEPLRAALRTLRERAIERPAKPAPLSAVALRPSCHGMPGAFAAGEPRCVVCAYSDTCPTFADLVCRQVHSVTGHRDPRRAALRARANARMARCRANKRRVPAAEFEGSPA